MFQPGVLRTPLTRSTSADSDQLPKEPQDTTEYANRELPTVDTNFEWYINDDGERVAYCTWCGIKQEKCPRCDAKYNDSPRLVATLFLPFEGGDDDDDEEQDEGLKRKHTQSKKRGADASDDEDESYAEDNEQEEESDRDADDDDGASDGDDADNQESGPKRRKTIRVSDDK